MQERYSSQMSSIERLSRPTPPQLSTLDFYFFILYININKIIKIIMAVESVSNF